MDSPFSPNRFYNTTASFSDNSYFEPSPYLSPSRNTDTIFLRSEVDRLARTCKQLDEENQRLKKISGQDYEFGRIRNMEGSTADSIAVADLTQDNRRLSYELSEKMKEVDEWKAKFTRLEHSFSGTLIAESQYVSLEKSDMYISQIRALTSERDRLNAILIEKDRIILDLKTRQEGPYVVHRRYETVSREEAILREVLMDRDHTIEIMRGDIARLERELYESDLRSRLVISTAQDHRPTEVIQEKTVSSKVEISQSQEVDSRIAVLIKEKEKLKASLNEKIQDYESLKQMVEGDESGQTIIQLKSKITVLVNDNKELNRIISEKDEELDEFKKKLVGLTGLESKSKVNLKEKMEQFSELEIKLKSVTQERDQLKAKLADRAKECETLKIKLNEMEEESYIIVELKSKVKILSSECEELKRVLTEKSTEIEDLEVKIAEYVKSETKVKSILKEKSTLLTNTEAKLNSTIQEKNKQAAIVAERTKEFEGLNKMFCELENEYEQTLEERNQLVSENGELQNIIAEEGTKIETLMAKLGEDEGKLKILTQEVSKLTQAVAQKNTEIASYKSMMQKLEKDVAQINELKLKISRMSEDNENLKARLKEKTSREMKSPKAESSKSSTPHAQTRNLETEKAELIQAYEAERQEYLQAIEMGEQIISELRMQLETSQQKSPSNGGQWKQKYIALEDEYRTLEENFGKLEKDSEEVVTELGNRLTAIMNENQRLGRELIAKQKEANDAKRRADSLIEMESKFNIMVQEKGKLVALLNDKSYEVEKVKAKFIEMQEDIKEHKEQYEAVSAEKRELEMDIALLKIELHTVKTRKDERLVPLQNKIETLTKEKEELNMVLTEKQQEIEICKVKITELESMFVVISDLEMQLTQAQTVIDEWTLKYSKLEKLYISVRDATVQLDVIEKQYQVAMETKEQVDSYLKLSSDSRTLKKSIQVQKTLEMDDVKSIGLEARTALSLETSPVSAKHFMGTKLEQK